MTRIKGLLDMTSVRHESVQESEEVQVSKKETNVWDKVYDICRIVIVVVLSFIVFESTKGYELQHWFVNAVMVIGVFTWLVDSRWFQRKKARFSKYLKCKLRNWIKED